MVCLFVINICTITFSFFPVNTHWPLRVPCNWFREEYLTVSVYILSGVPTVHPDIVNPVSVSSGTEFEVGGVISTVELRTFVLTGGHLTAIPES